MPNEHLSYQPKANTILLGNLVGEAVLEDGKRLTIVGSGKLIRFTVDGHPGYVDLNLTPFAEEAVELLTTRPYRQRILAGYERKRLEEEATGYGIVDVELYTDSDLEREVAYQEALVKKI